MVKLDILDLLEEETGFVRLVLTSGAIEYGKPGIVCWGGEDDTIKEIMFEPYFNPNEIKRFYRIEDIESYDPCGEEDIPPYE